MNVNSGTMNAVTSSMNSVSTSMTSDSGIGHMGMFRTIPIVKPIRPRKPRVRTVPPKRHSLYWTYFAFITENDGKVNEETIVCRLCGQTYRFSGNTTNLKSHLSRHHREEYAELEKKQMSPQMSHVSITPATIPRSATEISSSDGTMSAVTSTPNRSQHQSSSNVGGANVEITTVYVVPHPDTIAAAILTWLYVDLMPIHSVTGDGFRRLLMACNPNLEIPVPGDISQGVSKMYDTELMKISEEIKSVSAISISVEVWSTSEHEHFVTVRGFWISENWELNGKVLQTRPVEDKENYEMLATEITNCLTACPDMLSKVMCVVAATSPALEKAVVHHLGVQLIPCLAHTLNGSLKQAMESTTLLGGVIQRLQSQHVDGGGDRSSTYGPGRSWSTIYSLLVKAAEQQTSLAEFMVQNADLGIIKEAILFLQSFKLASDGMCSERYPPASMLLPLLYRLIHLNTDLSNSLAKILRTRVATATRSYWEDPQVTKILNTVSFFDPRFKTLPHLNPTQRQEVTQFVQQEVGALLEADGEDGTLPEAPKQQKDGSLMGSLLGGLFDDPGGFTQPNSQTSGRIQEEIDKYSLEQRLNTNCSPLEWWRVHQSNYPALAKVARKYLSISCTSVPAAWVLTDQGEMIHHKKVGLEPEYRDKLIFLHENADSSSDV